MDDNSVPELAPAGWLEALARSEAQLAAGRIVSGEEIMRELDESMKAADSALSRDAAAASLPAFAVVWSEQEDDVYDTL